MQIVTKLPIKGLHRLIRDANLSIQAQKRLTWMDFLDSSHTFAETSRHFFEPESTIRFWRKRYNRYKPNSLVNHTSRPHHTRALYVPSCVLEKIKEIRKPYCVGKVKLQDELREQGIIIGQSKIQKLIGMMNLKCHKKIRKHVKRQNRKHMYTVPKEVYKRPGGLVYLDVKHLLLPGGLKACQFVALDHSTRYLATKVFSRITSRSTVEFLGYLQKQEPFTTIKYIGTDNGSEFLGEFEKALKEKQVLHVFSSPRSPKQNPFVERVIRTIIDELYSQQGLATTREGLNDKLQRYVIYYNTKRRHFGLNLLTPQRKLEMLQLDSAFYCFPQEVPNQYMNLPKNTLCYTITYGNTTRNNSRSVKDRRKDQRV
ncbi:hypothetical protein COX64_04895 [Candidatus Dojkabacteria bacterium CG_4_10_14_0_2_um_filter_Dojkabacteria_WS6_41_15]|uniref:Integrase catalytic domain-containing protein n=1 Tax=Candidatus Dojkabacteria bacterium CG_4_10_14_0_2_um_filter_Dojkabacteria_WS6_41_15 TaxID=2014249 RepID=A0A2M7W0W9_9BACT|nr:MAG: hypothetical protein COX64_04895 [Candidatus Dojkabacteria bacterium CG_4_10_14_0_2_um_filter_Dojkabacteria_WS6_41_15]